MCSTARPETGKAHRLGSIVRSAGQEQSHRYLRETQMQWHQRKAKASPQTGCYPSQCRLSLEDRAVPAFHMHWCLAARYLVFCSQIRSSAKSIVQPTSCGNVRSDLLACNTSPILKRAPHANAKMAASQAHPQLSARKKPPGSAQALLCSVKQAQKSPT